MPDTGGSAAKCTDLLSAGPDAQASVDAPLTQTDTADSEFIHPNWVESSVARRAIKASDWPNCTPLQFLEALHTVVEVIDLAKAELAEHLAARGLTTGEFLQLVADARANGRPVGREDKHLSMERRESYGAGGGDRRDSWDYFGEERAAERALGAKSVRRLWLAGYDAGQISALLDWPVENIQLQLDMGHYAEAGRTVLALHHKGLSASAIAKEAETPRTAVYKILADAGLKPHRERRKVDPAAKRDAVADYRTGLYSYGEIADRRQLTLDDVQNALRAAHKRGQCPEYGRRYEERSG